MKHFSIIAFSLLLMITSCSKKLDDVALPFNDNPYDNDYTGPKVLRIDSVDYSNIFGFNYVSFTKVVSDFNNYDGVRLYRNGVKIKTVYTNYSQLITEITDASPVSGVTYSYEVRLYLGSGETDSEPVSFTTP